MEKVNSKLKVTKIIIVGTFSHIFPFLKPLKAMIVNIRVCTIQKVLLKLFLPSIVQTGENIAVNIKGLFIDLNLESLPGPITSSRQVSLGL